MNKIEKIKVIVKSEDFVRVSHAALVVDLRDFLVALLCSLGEIIRLTSLL